LTKTSSKNNNNDLISSFGVSLNVLMNSVSKINSIVASIFVILGAVIQGAGGVFTNWEGGSAGLHSGNQYIASGDPRVHEQALRILAG